MKVFVWTYVGHVSDRYHSDGGLVVFADTEERARELALQQDGCYLKPEEMPDDVREVSTGTEAVYVFPDAGCC